jgi:hypothetical protein
MSNNLVVILVAAVLVPILRIKALVVTKAVALQDVTRKQTNDTRKRMVDMNSDNNTFTEFDFLC